MGANGIRVKAAGTGEEGAAAIRESEVTETR